MTEQFAIVEQMGHRRFGAKIFEAERFGIKWLRAEVLCDPPAEVFVHPQSLYAVTTCTEEQARKANDRWSLRDVVPALPAAIDRASSAADDDDSGLDPELCPGHLEPHDKPTRRTHAVEGPNFDATPSWESQFCQRCAEVYCAENPGHAVNDSPDIPF